MKLPSVVIVPPVATIYCSVGASSAFPESVTIHPFVESTKTNVTATPFVFKVALTVEPPILSEPF